jgi:hypothetical protein
VSVKARRLDGKVAAVVGFDRRARTFRARHPARLGGWTTPGRRAFSHRMSLPNGVGLPVVKYLRLIVAITVGAIGLYASLIAIYVLESAYPKLDAYSGGINTPFELVISNPGYLCFYDVSPACSGINLSFDNGPGPIEEASVAFPDLKEKICPNKPRTFSCGVGSLPPRAGATLTLSLHYSVHLLPLLPFPKWSMDCRIPCRLGTAGVWFCGEPM